MKFTISNSRQFCLILFLSILTVSSKGQSEQIVRKVVQVMTPQTFYLNGGTRATFGGKSRVTYQITLPPNTVEWYYAFTTSKNENSPTHIGLLAQLSRLFDPTGISAIVSNAITTPTGAGVCDIYLMDRNNAQAFSEKVDNWGGRYYYQPSGSRENFKQGTVQIRDIQNGNWVLGFRNPSALEGINVTFEVVAIVEVTEPFR